VFEKPIRFSFKRIRIRRKKRKKTKKKHGPKSKKLIRQRRINGSGKIRIRLRSHQGFSIHDKRGGVQNSGIYPTLQLVLNPGGVSIRLKTRIERRRI
jgi:hypothetical protein